MPEIKFQLLRHAGLPIILNTMGTDLSSKQYEAQREIAFTSPPSDGTYLTIFELQAMEKLDPRRINGSIDRLRDVGGKKVIAALIDHGNRDLWEEILEIYQNGFQRVSVEFVWEFFPDREAGLDWLVETYGTA